MPSVEFEGLLQNLKSSPFPAAIAEARVAYDELASNFPASVGVSVSSRSLGQRPCEVFDPQSGSTLARGVVLYLHGGGFCIGGLNSHRHVGAELAKVSERTVMHLDYRLAPENPFPAALDDAFQAYSELLGEVGEPRIVLAGDSAGGGLVMALLARILAGKLPRPTGIYLMSPWVSMVSEGGSRVSKRDADPIASVEQLEFMCRLYVADKNPNAPEISALNGNFAGAPRTFIQVGTSEILLDDAVRLAGMLGSFDVDVELSIRSKMIHTWPYFFPIIPEGREAVDQAGQFLRSCLT